jgi:hypothetical protein
MSSVFSFIKGYWADHPPETPLASGEGINNGDFDKKVSSSNLSTVSDNSEMIPSGAATPLTSHTNGGKCKLPQEQADELTSLLAAKNNDNNTNGIRGGGKELDPADPGDDILHPLPKKPPSAYDYYFKSNNPTVQRYYRFTATPITPIVALHKKPGTGHGAVVTSGVTGLLRRSAVVPSHGTDATGEWILVSVGGRSGWARKKLPEQHFSGFALAETFTATEGWMGNHAFLCRGTVMLGSDAPSFFFTNLLLLVGYILHFAVLLPRLTVIEQQAEANGSIPHYVLFLFRMDTMFWGSLICAVVAFATLWISAIMDPGIIPPVSTPVKAPVPGEGIPLGGPLGYRYCSTCNIFRPPRSKHCNSCNVCVSKFDQYVVVSCVC